jgi:hypothetical protein
MALPKVLVSTYHPTPGASALLLLDLNTGTYQVLLPYPGPLCTTPDALHVIHTHRHRVFLEKYDRDGLVWRRRVAGCLDTHSLALVGEEIAVCSTGTNEVIYLDENGVERRRWSPDDDAEADSWHINSLTTHEGRLFATCFGWFDHFRGWSGKVPEAGLLLDVAANRAILDGLSAPHDPRRVADGWVVNDSDKSRTLLIPDRGPTQVIVSAPGFSRGLAVLEDAYVVGFSSPRTLQRQDGCAAVLLVDRQSHTVLKSINVPYPEIGHIYPAPAEPVLAAVKRDGARTEPCLPLSYEPIAERDRAGAIVALGPLRPTPVNPTVFEVDLRVTNEGGALWWSGDEMPVHIACQFLDDEGKVVFGEGPRTKLPLPVLPGKTLTFPIQIDLAFCRRLPVTVLRITLVQETVAWWRRTDAWLPAIVGLPALAERQPAA